jgi:acetyltransferase-like isoleucine patch superfamily enzyme
MAVFPHFLRKLVFKFSCRRFGKGSFIDYGSFINYPWKLSIGNNVEINRGFQAFCSYIDPAVMIVIEDEVIIAPNVSIYASGQNPKDPQSIDVASSVVIRRGAYIGANSVIRYGVTIGESAVVGAGSTVVKSLPAKSIAAGNPAKVIRKL